MKHFHVKKGMKKALAFSLAVAMTVSGMAAIGTVSASAEDVSVPQPAKTMDLENGFKGDGLSQAKFGSLLGFLEQSNVYDTKTGRVLGTYKKSDKVLVQGTFNTENKDDATHMEGYETASIPSGAEQQYIPDMTTDKGEFIQTPCAWNQPTTAYDSTKGMVFWLEDTLTNQSYPTYATTVNEETGIPTTNWDVIVKDTKGQYMEYGVNNSAAEFESPLKNSSASGFTFSAWIKNTTPYKAPVVYNKLGDLDGSGGTDMSDVLIALKHYLEIEEISEDGLVYADVNGDTNVDMGDVLDLLKYYLEIITEFKAPEPGAAEAGEETVTLLEDSEFFHVERRVVGKTENTVTHKMEVDERRNIEEREYLYFSGDGVTYVGDWENENSVCTWTLADAEAETDETVNLRNSKNGGQWIYVSYTFDGTDFHMYLGEKEVTLEKNAGSSYNAANIMKLVSNSKAVTYLGGRGGGMKANYNSHKIQTSSKYYMDDIAIYTSALTEAQIQKAYADAEAAMEPKAYTTLKTYDFNNTSLAANELTAVTGATSAQLPKTTAGKKGNCLAIQSMKSGEKHGGVQLSTNPFTGKDFTGVSISYWMKEEDNGFGGVQDGVLLSFIDDTKTCGTEKTEFTEAKSQLYLNAAFIGGFNEAVTNSFGTMNIKNTFVYTPYPYGDPKNLTNEKKKVEMYDSKNSYYSDWLAMKKTLKDDWYFITVTFNNAGFTMYKNGEVVENKWIDYAGIRFCDSYHLRLTNPAPQFTRKETNNAGARSLMDFLTASDTKVYIGYAYAINSASNFMTTPGNKNEVTNGAYIDELSFYDKDLSAEEVRALYNKVK